MKKLGSIALLLCATLTASAQGKFEVKEFGSFKLHSYITADPLGDMSYIIEGNKSVVVLEPAAFHDNIKELGEYLGKLNKPVEKVIANYHAAGFSAFDHSKFVMVEGMPQFVKGDVYSGMMANFATTFGNKMDISQFTPSVTVGKDAKENWAGVEFKFSPGASSDFPAASILIGGKVYYTHFTPVANMHMSALQITSLEAVDAQLAGLEHAKASGATTFIGGHGGATASAEAVNFQIEYLKKVKETRLQIRTGDEFVLVMQMTYPDIAGEENLTAVATNLYKK